MTTERDFKTNSAKSSQDKGKSGQLKGQEEQARKTQEELTIRTAHFIKGSLKLILQLIMGGCIMVIFVLIAWGCDRLALRFNTESPITALACRITGACILGAGVVSVAVFVYATTRDFVRSVIKGPLQETTKPEATGEGRIG